MDALIRRENTMKAEKCLFIIACIASIALLVMPETYDWLVRILGG